MTVPPPAFPPPAPPAKKDNSTKLVITIIGAITALAAICCIGIIATTDTPHPNPNKTNQIDQALDTTTSSSQQPEETETTPPLETTTINGTGDDVVTLDTPITVVALLTFECPHCTANVNVKTDNDLIVNEIDAYTGTHLINTRNGDTTTNITITTNHDWTLTIEDLTKAPKDLKKGTGSTVTIHTTTYTKAEITHNGSSNLIIHTYNPDGGELALNEIGQYTGTIPINAPAIISIQADGDWTITPK